MYSGKGELSIYPLELKKRESIFCLFPDTSSCPECSWVPCSLDPLHVGTKKKLVWSCSFPVWEAFGNGQGRDLPKPPQISWLLGCFYSWWDCNLNPCQGVFSFLVCDRSMSHLLLHAVGLSSVLSMQFKSHYLPSARWPKGVKSLTSIKGCY